MRFPVTSIFSLRGLRRLGQQEMLQIAFVGNNGRVTPEADTGKCPNQWRLRRETGRKATGGRWQRAGVGSCPESLASPLLCCRRRIVPSCPKQNVPSLFCCVSLMALHNVFLTHFHIPLHCRDKLINLGNSGGVFENPFADSSII